MAQQNRKVEVTQINWDGQGHDRTFTYWRSTEQLPEKFERIAMGQNLAGGRVKVFLDGRDVTAAVTELSYC